MLSINQTPMQQPVQTPAFKAGDKNKIKFLRKYMNNRFKDSIKDEKKIYQMIDDMNFEIRLRNAPPEQRPYLLNLRIAEQWASSSFLEKVGIVSKEICKSCVEKLNPKNWKK